jgi:hypothetical protein
MFFGFQYIADITYASITKKNYNPYIFKNFLDLWLFIIYAVFVFTTLGINLKTLWNEGQGFFPFDNQAKIYCKNYVDININETALLIVALVSMWIRVINFLRYNEYIGRFFGVVKRLIYELILFFLLYLLNLLLFALVAESSFRGQP